MSEKWKPIEGWPFYEVSNHGRVRSLTRVIEFRDGRSMEYRGKVITGAIDDKGYRHVNLSLENKVSTFRVHRLVLEAFVGPCPPGHETRHLDSDPTNNRRSNLAWGTPKENAADRGPIDNHGERNPRAKITEDDVREIRIAAAAGETNRSIADRYGIAHNTVSIIVHRLSWSHVD